MKVKVEQELCHHKVQVEFAKQSHIQQTVKVIGKLTELVFFSIFDKYAEKYKDALCLGDKWLFDAGYNLQKYVDGDGYFDLHSEQGLRYPLRMLAWMVYLNDAK